MSSKELLICLKLFRKQREPLKQQRASTRRHLWIWFRWLHLSHSLWPQLAFSFSAHFMAYYVANQLIMNHLRISHGDIHSVCYGRCDLFPYHTSKCVAVSEFLSLLVSFNVSWARSYSKWVASSIPFWFFIQSFVFSVSVAQFFARRKMSWVRREHWAKHCSHWRPFVHLAGEVESLALVVQAHMFMAGHPAPPFVHQMTQMTFDHLWSTTTAKIAVLIRWFAVCTYIDGIGWIMLDPSVKMVFTSLGL